jgi:hypothetical protein
LNSKKFFRQGPDKWVRFGALKSYPAEQHIKTFRFFCKFRNCQNFFDMRMIFDGVRLILFLFFLFQSCKTSNREISSQEINALGLKKGEVILCGPADKNFGHLTFEVS